MRERSLTLFEEQLVYLIQTDRSTVLKLNSFFLFLSKKKELITSDMSLNINSSNIISSNWVKLLGIKINSILCKFATRQLNALLWLKSYLTFEARKTLIESYVYSNFNYQLQFGILRVQKHLIKLRENNKERQDFYLTITKVFMRLFL